MRNRWMSFVLCLTVASCVVPDVETFEPGHDSGGPSDSGPDVSAKDSASDQRAMPEGSRDVAQQDALIDKGSTGTGDDDAPSEVIDGEGALATPARPRSRRASVRPATPAVGQITPSRLVLIVIGSRPPNAWGPPRCAPRVRARRVRPVSSGAPTRPISNGATRAGNGSLTAPVPPRPQSASRGNAPFVSQAPSVAPATYPSSAARRATRGNARRRAPGQPPRVSPQRPLAVAAPRGPCSATETCHSAAMPPGNGSPSRRAPALCRNVSRGPVWRAIRARGLVGAA